MKDFLLLLKYDLLRLVKSGKNKGRQGGKFVITGAVLLLFAVLIVGMSSLYTAIFTSILPDESKHVGLGLIVLLYCVIFLISTVGTSKILFGATDYDFLNSLPLKPRAIILSKLAYVYIIGLAGALLCFIPATTVYMIIAKSGAITLLNTLLFIPFIPLLPLTVGLIVGTAFHILMSKVKRKSLVGTILALAFLAVYFYFMLGTGFSDMEDEELALTLTQLPAFIKIFAFMAKGITGSYLNILITDLSLLVIAFLYVVTVSKYYNKVNGLICARRTGKGADLTKQKGSSLTGTLVKRELKLYFSNSTIVINSIIGPLMAIVFPIILLINGGGVFDLGDMEVTPGDMEFLNIVKQVALPYIPFFFIGISVFTAFSVSLEGKTLWFIKSLPISAKNWLTAKVITCLIFTLPSGVISVILFGIAFSSTWYDVLIAIAIIATYSIVGALLGLAVNLKYHNFEWSNPAEVVKRGASATICTFVGMLAVIPVLALQIVGTLISVYLGFALVFAVLLTLAYLFYYISYKNAEQKLLQM